MQHSVSILSNKIDVLVRSRLALLVTVSFNVVQPLENIESISHKDNPVAIADMPTKVHNGWSNVFK